MVVEEGMGYRKIFYGAMREHPPGSLKVILMQQRVDRIGDVRTDNALDVQVAPLYEGQQSGVHLDHQGHVGRNQNMPQLLQILDSPDDEIVSLLPLFLLLGRRLALHVFLGKRLSVTRRSGVRHSGGILQTCIWCCSISLSRKSTSS